MRTWQRYTIAGLMAAALLHGETAGHARQARPRPAAVAIVNVTFMPYLQPGDAGRLGATDTKIIAWQTDETTPSNAYLVSARPNIPGADPLPVTPVGRVVDNYLAADPAFNGLVLPNPYGPHTDYEATLTGLTLDTDYIYTVSGPGLPTGGFTATFHTRKTGSQSSFEVQGDEGYYPNIPNTADIVDYMARIIHEMYHVDALTQNGGIPGVPALPRPNLALNTGDNVYISGTDGNYKDVWFRTWNSDADDNDDGAPFIRSLPLYIVVGNHDVGGTGASANLLADSGPTTPGLAGPGPFGGGVGGGDAMAHFNNFYDPLNGPAGVDIQYVFNADLFAPSGFYFNYNGASFMVNGAPYYSPAAVEALRASTTVDAGQGPKRQIDHESNYSFDNGSVHFTFLDANPHLFNALLPGGPPGTAPAFPFPSYPSVLRQWLIADLDGSAQPWKVVVFHQPAFSSGNATLSNDQMRRVAKFLEDHGVNLVFNGHEHNYQRTFPLRVLPGATRAPTENGPPAVAVDTAFDGATDTVPDGVLYFVEGAGGNRDFDDDFANPRGSSLGIDQDDAATGTYTQQVNGQSYAFLNGPSSWLDTNLTDDAMKAFLPGAGSGPKITAKFKSKVFSFADVVVNGNTLSLYQISEPLSNAAPTVSFGTDYQGRPLNQPLPDTVLDPSNPSNPAVIQSAGAGTPALLDTITVTKPAVMGTVTVALSAPPAAAVGGALVYSLALANGGAFALNGTQVVLTLPAGVTLAAPTGDTLTQQGQTVVLTLGRLAPGQTLYAQIPVKVSPGAANPFVTPPVTLRSSTALPVTSAGTVTTRIIAVPPPRPRH
ncbi:MAG: metallophosphoesterase [Armatimonadetes bacterium]|nr:metallophosphoesterase [Armatimonadota bacterium]